MRTDLLERLMRLAARTGERHVLVDASLPEPIVVLPLSAYEAMTAGSAPSRAPALAAQPAAAWESDASFPPPAPSHPAAQEALNEEEKFYLEPIE